MALFASQAITSSGEAITRRHYAKFFLVCLSYANLCFLNVWFSLQDRGYDFWRRDGVTWQTIVAITLDILILACVAWGIVYVVLRTGHDRWIRLLKWCAILALLLPLNVLRTEEGLGSMQRLQIPSALSWRIVMVVVAVGLAILLLLNWQRFSTRVTTLLLILMAPSMPLALGSAVWQVIHAPPGSRFPDKPLQPALPQPPDAARVIWVLFDEWDYDLTFPERPAGISLPEVDRFRQKAFVATRMLPPARMTIVSVPSLLTGKTYVSTEPKTPSEIMLTSVEGKPPVRLTAQDTIFTEARRRGFNVGIAGWYIPYCHLIPECTTCSWQPAIALSWGSQFENPYSVPHLMKEILLGLVKKIPLLGRMGLDLDTPANQRLHALSYTQVRNDMLRAIADPRLNLVYVHMNVPHPPALYDSSTDRISTGHNISYLDNLRLVDRTVRDIRETLESAGLWDASTILLTSDHPLRVDRWPRDPAVRKGLKQHAEVPYLLKMPGQTQGLTYDRDAHEVVTKDLLLAILTKQVTTSQQVAAWFDAKPPYQ
ncbi:MAG TPA: sulfatase-like hydrolase/transferase [Candidatus Acidoferrales bacterium]|jgi:hypothetical protein|nr:sulfatase-like hydrolase/transferase [Candidatus Acidoferrales bacterium]